VHDTSYCTPIPTLLKVRCRIYTKSARIYYAIFRYNQDTLTFSVQPPLCDIIDKKHLGLLNDETKGSDKLRTSVSTSGIQYGADNV
jgi:hypothetical protein